MCPPAGRAGRRRTSFQISSGGANMSEAVAVAQRQSLLARIKGALLKARQEWPVIAGERTSIGGLMLSYVAVIAAIPVVAQMIGMLVFDISVLGVTYRPPINCASTGESGRAHV